MGTRFIAVAIVVATVGVAGAQTPPVKSKQYDFSDENLEGDLAKPDGELVMVAPAKLRGFDPAASPKRRAELERALAGASPDKPARAEQFLELAELHAAEASYWRMKALESEIAASDAKDPARRGQLQASAKRDLATHQAALARALAIYTDLLCDPADRARGFACAGRAALRGWPRLHDAIFEAAYLLDGGKRGADAGKLHLRLIADHPQSPHVGHALLATAERAFEEGRMPEAEALYAKVLASKATALHGYARYKTGWVQINLGRDQDAYASFAGVIAAAGKDPRGAALAREARRDLVRAYSNFGKADAAFAEFERIAPGGGVDMLAWLGDLWQDQGRNDAAAAILKEVQTRAPADVRACAWQHGVVRAMLVTAQRSQIIGEVERLLVVYRKARAVKGFPAATLKSCREETAKVINDLARVYHIESVKAMQGPQMLVDAEKLYGLYLTSFPDAADAPAMRYYRAEVAWTRASHERNPQLAIPMWEEAAARHTEAANDTKLEAKLRKESAYAAVLAWKNALAVDPVARPAPADPGQDQGPQPIPERERKMLAAFKNYAATIKDPKDDELVNMKFLEARIYWRHGHLDDAVRRFEGIVSDHQDHEVAEYAANLLIDTLNRQGKHDVMLGWVDRLLAQKRFMDNHPELQATLNTLKRQGRRVAAQKLEKAGDLEGCGTAYVDVYNLEPDAADNDEVLYNAGVCFQQAGKIGIALQMYGILDKQFPKSRLAPKALARTGLLRARVAHYAEAAAALEKYAKTYGGEQDAVDALSEAIFYYRTLGEHDKAIAATEMFVKQYGRRQADRAADAAFSLIGMYEQAGRQDQAARALEDYVRIWSRAGGTEREVIALVKLGIHEWTRSCKLKGTLDGACLQLVRPPARPQRPGAQPTHCFPAAPRVVKSARDAAMAKRGQAHLKLAIAVAGKSGTGTPAMMSFVAAAEWYLAEEDFEKALLIAFPGNLNFDPDKPKVVEASRKSFQAYLSAKQAALGQLRADHGTYGRLLQAEHAGEWRFAAIARLGQATSDWAAQLRGAPIPAVVRTGAYAAHKVKAYCEELGIQADPLRDLAADSYDFCLTTAAKLGASNPWTAVCARELAALRPESAPPRELRAAPTGTPPIIQIEPIARMK
jgi:outer membrane protein assembly factor BamD (BamD/ComL family)